MGARATFATENKTMDTSAQHLLAEALKLPADTREDLAVRLMGSVEPTSAGEIKQAWVEEIDHRMAKLESGESTAVSIEDAWPKVAGKPWRSQSSDNA